MKKHITKAFALFSALIFFTSCKPQKVKDSFLSNEQSTGIISGNPVEKTHPAYWMTARILTLSDDVWFPVCTASILGKDLILTAAHCIEGQSYSDLRIAFDAQPLSYSGQLNPKSRVDVLTKFKTVGVKEYVIHPQYGNTDYDHDIALIRIDSQIPPEFKPVRLLTELQMSRIREDREYQVHLVGYGLFQEIPQIDSEILRETNVPARFEGLHLITDQTGGSGGCNGDSGGPAYLKIGKTFYLVGVTHGPTTGVYDCAHGGVWGNPNHDREFLVQSAEKMGSKLNIFRPKKETQD